MSRYTFEPVVDLDEIILVGLGGTGSQLARSLCRIVYDMRSRNLQIPRLRFVDPDIVEPKNVGRQMFAAVDIGRYKAEVLARRFSAALGLNIIWHNEAFDPEAHIRNEYYRRDKVLVGAVDNHLARRALAQAKALWIDCGNHYAAGQVVLGNTSSAHVVGDVLTRAATQRPQLAALSETLPTSILPNAALVFPQLLEPETTVAPDRSCADLVQMGEQHLLINDLIADVAAQYLYKLLHRQPIQSFITYVDAEALSMRSVPITRADIEAYIGPLEVCA